MATPLVAANVASIYKVAGRAAPLPARLARCSPDLKQALFQLSAAVRAKGGELLLSDMFRSYEMQLQAHLDFTSGKKRAFSPAPGGSLHEAGRAFDLDLSALQMPLSDFWDIAHGVSLVPIIEKPESTASEAWHFECRGSHQLVYDYYASGSGHNFESPYAAMAASAIVSVGIRVDKLGESLKMAMIQSSLIRLKKDIGNLDGSFGPKTRAALEALDLAGSTGPQQLAALEAQLQAAFPDEFFDRVPEPLPIS